MCDFVHTQNKIKCVTKEEHMMKTADQLVIEEAESLARAEVSRNKATIAKTKRAQRANKLREQRTARRKLKYDKFIAGKEE